MTISWRRSRRLTNKIFHDYRSANDMLKPIDKVSLGLMSELPGLQRFHHLGFMQTNEDRDLIVKGNRRIQYLDQIAWVVGKYLPTALSLFLESSNLVRVKTPHRCNRDMAGRQIFISR